MDYNMYNNKCLKPEGTLTDILSNQPSRDHQQQPQQQPNFPEWINEFSLKCLKICGTKCAEKLDETMEHYIQEIKKELFLCDSSPNRASLIANRMSKTLVFFYLYYSDIKEFFVISQWSENISQLLLYYCRLELKASHRVHRGKDSDTLVCSRIMNALWIYLNNNYEAMIHIILQMPQIGRRHKDILDPVFRKLLMSKRQKPMTELEYVRNLLAFKLWKRLYGKEDKKAISHLALTELKPPRSFMANYKKYKSLPACPNNVDVHTHFVTGLIDLESAIKEYLEVYHRTKRTDYHPTEKKSFISDFCSSFEGIENTPDDIGDSYMLDKIKNENDIQEIEDDDCIIVEDPVDPLPPVVPRIVPPDPTEVIDLTADEPDNQLNLSDDVVPVWCKELIKQSEELKITPPPSPVIENQSENTIEAKLEMLAQRKDLLTPIENLDIVEKEPITPIRDVVTPKTDIASPKLDTLPPRKDITPPSPPATIEENMSSEDNSTGLTEITSTSHPVQDVTQDIVDSSDFTPIEPSTETAKEVYKDNFEHVDSTSNINEEDCDIDIEEPTVKAFVVERTVSDGIVCSEIISEVSDENGPVEDNISEQTVSAVSNIEFEQFASQNVSNVIENHLVISHVTGKSDISRFISDSDELTDDILDEDSDPIDSISDNNNSDTPVLLDKESESSLHSQHEIDDFTSPAIEPMSGKDFANYLAGLNSDMYEEFNKNPDPLVGDVQINKKRKIEENSVRTYTKRTVRFDTLLTPEPILPEPQIPPPEPKERRVPLNGERVRFGDIWESIYTGTFNLTQKECKLLMPNIIVKKENPKYWIQGYERFTADDDSDDVLEELKNPFNVHHLYGTAMAAKKILERQDYLKPKKGAEENPRARVIKRPIPGSLHSPVSSESKLPDVLMQTKRRGTVSPDLNINLTLPKFESLSLNSSFQHHFCTDISACTSASKCFIPNCGESLPHTSQNIPIIPPATPSTSGTANTPSTPYDKPIVSKPAAFQQTDNSLPNIPPCTVPSQPILSHPVPSQPIPSQPIPSQPIPSQTISSQPIPVPILPAEVPYWHEIEDQHKLDSSSQSSGHNLLVNINLDNCNTDEIHLPIKKRRVSSLKVEIKDELSYPSTPMISIAELESIETERNKANVNRPFKTPAELKEVPPLPASYMCNINPVSSHVITENFNINHTYNTPTINYHVNNVPVINFQYNPHYQLPSIQPILLPVNRTPSSNWNPATYGYVKLPTAGKSETSTVATGKKRTQAARTTERTVSVTSRTVQKNKSLKSKK